MIPRILPCGAGSGFGHDHAACKKCQHHGRAADGVAAAVLLAVRGAGADRRARRHRLPVAVHHLDEPERVEGRPADRVRRARQLPADAERPALRRGGLAHAGLHAALGAAAADLRHAGRRGVSPEISAARLPARPLHHADDGDAGGDRAGVDHDVPPAARRAELSALARRHAAAALGVPSRHRDPLAGPGRDLAMDAAGDADRARRAGGDPDRTL